MGASVTTNAGTSWTRHKFGALQGMAYSLAMDPANRNVMYAGGYENTGSNTPAVYKTTNGGAIWAKLAGTGLTGYVYALVVDPNNSNNLFAGTSATVYKSTDAGNTWATTGFTGGYTLTMAVLVTARATTFYAGTYSNGVYATTNTGSTWTQMNTGLDNLHINSLRTSSNQYLFAGTDGGSVYRWNLQVGAEESPGIVSSETFVFTVNPNPSSGQTRMTYQLPAAAAVAISIYDRTGGLIKTLAATGYRGGRATVTWDGTDDRGAAVPSGVYFCKLTASDQVRVEKLVILK